MNILVYTNMIISGGVLLFFSYLCRDMKRVPMFGTGSIHPECEE